VNDLASRASSDLEWIRGLAQTDGRVRSRLALKHDDAQHRAECQKQTARDATHFAHLQRIEYKHLKL